MSDDSTPNHIIHQFELTKIIVNDSTRDTIRDDLRTCYGRSKQVKACVKDRVV